jgi:predicted membrane channel-forming protein YqfA (hemolysin III family)
MFETLSYKARRRWSLVVLLVGMPIYVVACITVVNLIERPALWLELLIYVGLGLAWIVPFKGLFRGIGQADPDAPDDSEG